MDREYNSSQGVIIGSDGIVATEYKDERHEKDTRKKEYPAVLQEPPCDGREGIHAPAKAPSVLRLNRSRGGANDGHVGLLGVIVERNDRDGQKNKIKDERTDVAYDR